MMTPAMSEPTMISTLVLMEARRDDCGCNGGARFRSALEAVLQLAEDAKIMGTLVEPRDVAFVITEDLT
jgi:hypothetical protein